MLWLLMTLMDEERWANGERESARRWLRRCRSRPRAQPRSASSDQLDPKLQPRLRSRKLEQAQPTSDVFPRFTMRYRTRQSYYLRTGPHSSLQLVLYIDPSHVHWMNVSRQRKESASLSWLADLTRLSLQDDVLSRMLIALKERIPVQLNKELHQSAASKAKQKNKVEVYRGSEHTSR